MKARFRLDWSDDEDEEEWEDVEEGECPQPDVEGPSYAAVFTGVLHPNGKPIIRHPVVLRMGFHPEDKKFHCPTREDTGFDEDSGRVFGWFYE